MADSADNTHVQTTLDTGLPPAPSSAAEPLPLSIGRYQVEDMLGCGGFGRVYLAFDSQLRRRVAVKVPRARRRGHAEFCQAFLAEAQILAKLDHPHIVPVYDVGSSDQYPCYIVSKYVDGANLHRRLPSLNWDWVQRTELVACIADALHCAHQAGLVHRDVKPGNILLDRTDRPFLADFGLALSDEVYLQADNPSGLVGTLNYMSPEQVRGEGHLVDARADIFSLGVVLYELLMGLRPFKADSREQVMWNILNGPIQPLRQRRPELPRELERICLRALERNPAWRYASAKDLSEELRALLDSWRRPSEVESPSALEAMSLASTQTQPPSIRPPVLASADPSSTGTNRAPRLVPKGMRAFDEADAEFFLQILPGPKDRHGVPESLRFWKHRIETAQADESFRIGVLYGPSGCGKSSLVRAGLLPLLASNVTSIVVSATGQGSEERLQRSLLAACPEVPAAPTAENLVGSLQYLRLHAPAPSHRKLLIVIDQFEQWLSQHGEDEDNTLLRALRQCDGVHVQCLLLVRNDFWMSISRTMQRLQSPILQGHNGWGVELFDKRHAQRVLFAFGHAYGALPDRVEQLSPPQARFLEQSIDQLADNERVICVRLAVFAQMLRDKKWEPQTLKQFGGVRGLGARFLEDTFYGTSSPPDCRRFASAAQVVLRNLLPKPGSDIRGAALSSLQLAQLARLRPDSAEFQRLLQLLCDDLRLLTAVDALSSQTVTEASHSRLAPSQHQFQLTHDYLVPSLRTWLNAKQRESIAGRAQLCLEERTALWEISREAKQLPKWLETVRILVWTHRDRWNESQAAMMRHATGHRARQLLLGGGLLATLLAALISGGRHLQQAARQTQADALVSQLVTARTDELLPIITALDAYPSLAEEQLTAFALQQPADVQEQFRALLAMSQRGQRWVEQLLQLAPQLDSHSLDLVRQRLHGTTWPSLTSHVEHVRSTTSPQGLLRHAALLALLSPQQAVTELSPRIAELSDALLLESDPQEFNRFCDYLRGLSDQLVPQLRLAYHDPLRNDSQRADAAKALAVFAGPDVLAELLLSASAAQHIHLIPAVQPQPEPVLAAIRQALGGHLATPEPPLETSRAVCNGLLVLVRLAPADPLLNVCLGLSPDGTPRSQFILQCHNYSIPLEKLREARAAASDSVARQALLLACEPYHAAGRPAARMQPFIDELQHLVARAPEQNERSAAQWLLKRWEVPLNPLASEYLQIDVSHGRDWWETSHGHTLRILQQPVLAEGPQALADPLEPPGTTARAATGARSFAISIHEITREQFSRFIADYEYIVNPTETDQCPANRVNAITAAQYCRWLSEQEGIPEEQMCLPPLAEINETHLHLSDETLKRYGYRLPTEAEWEWACHAGTTTTWSHGRDPQLLIHFAWFAANSEGRVYPVGSLLPNPAGLFDMHGSLSEWCHPVPTAGKDFAQRGGSYKDPNTTLASYKRNYLLSPPYSFTGFRIARTVPRPLSHP